METERLFKELVWDELVKVAVARLIAALPFLGMGPMGALTALVVGAIADKLYEVIAEFVDLKLIAFRNIAHQRAFTAASVTLKSVAKDKGIDSPEFRSAREEHKKALARFVRINAAA